jgi:hypothetical protein
MAKIQKLPEVKELIEAAKKETAFVQRTEPYRTSRL